MDGKLYPYFRGRSARNTSAWIVKCRLGEENSACHHLMRKGTTCAKTNKPLRIISVIAAAAIKGFVIIEASSHVHVQEAIEGITSLSTNLSPEDVKQMAEVARRNEEQTGIKLKLLSSSGSDMKAEGDAMAKKLQRKRELNRLAAIRYRKKNKGDRKQESKKKTQIYICDRCGAVCGTASTLTRHVKSHTAVYRCNYCDRAFNRLDARNRHQRNHEVKSSTYR